MRAHVLHDAALVKHAGRFVWLSIDTERDQNAAFVDKFPIANWPTLLVIDPAREAVAFKWLGSANVAQLERLLDDGERALAQTEGGTLEDQLARADRLFAEQQPAEAASAYRKLLEAAPADWSRRPRTVESLLLARYSAGDHLVCVLDARTLVPGLPRGPSFANAAAMGLACLLYARSPFASAAEVRAELEPLAREALALPDLLADDRSGLYELLVEARDSAGDDAGVQATARAWLDFLDREGERAPTPEARAALDGHRVAAALAAAEPTRAVAALERSERELPADYNAPARLALIYKALGHLDDALAATDRALARVYGPRRIRVLDTRADVLLARGDRDAARQVVNDALAFAAKLPPARVPVKVVNRLMTLQAELSSPP
jgi:tetratricopeptide (TPR) repeat protein